MPHEPYRRALVAVDFSPWSAAAVQVVRRVAPGVRLLLFSAFQAPFEDKLPFAGVDAETVEHYRRKARAEALQRLQALAQQAGLKADEWATQVAEGDASIRIVEAEQAQDCDLVVLGKHRQSATEELLLGSVTHHVLAEGSADVLVSTASQSCPDPPQSHRLPRCKVPAANDRFQMTRTVDLATKSGRSVAHIRLTPLPV